MSAGAVSAASSSFTTSTRAGSIGCSPSSIAAACRTAKSLVSHHVFDPAAETGGDRQVIFNRMSPSAYRRGEGSAIGHTLAWLQSLERAGHRVINGARGFSHEISKALQLSVLRRGSACRGPRARVIHRGDGRAGRRRGAALPRRRQTERRRQRRRHRALRHAGGSRAAAAEGRASISGFDHVGARAGVHPGARRPHRPRRVRRRAVSLRHQGAPLRRDVRPLPGRHLPDRRRRRARQRLRGRGAESRAARGRVRAAAAHRPRGGAHPDDDGHRRRRRRVHRRRSRRRSCTSTTSTRSRTSSPMRRQSSASSRTSASSTTCSSR